MGVAFRYLFASPAAVGVNFAAVGVTFPYIFRGWVSLGCPPELGRDDKTNQNETRRNNADDDDNDDEDGWG